MSNVLSEEKRQEILALGRLGWALRRIEAATGVRRETASSYLKAAGIAVREPRRRRAPKPASGEQALTDFSSEKAPGPAAKPASDTPTDGTRSPAASQCEPYRDIVELALGRGRNAVAIWQELVDEHGYRGAYTSVQRFVRKLLGSRSPEACASRHEV